MDDVVINSDEEASDNNSIEIPQNRTKKLKLSDKLNDLFLFSNL